MRPGSWSRPSRFESAERLFAAPTHLLHIAQCQAATGKLVEAQETYATLSHLSLDKQAPAAFREAQEAGRAEQAKIKPRVPTLRVVTSPAATSGNGCPNPPPSERAASIYRCVILKSVCPARIWIFTASSPRTAIHVRCVCRIP